MIVRPYGLVLEGTLELGLELLMEDGAVREIRPHTGVPNPSVVSPAFVNAHSHLEYFGLEGCVEGESYWPWIRELTRMKAEQSVERVRVDADEAGVRNRTTGVGYIAEHSDRPVSGKAMLGSGLDGVIFQEVITLGKDRKSRIEFVEMCKTENAALFGGPIHLSPHAYHTVDSATLYGMGTSRAPMSIHVAETELESEFTRSGEGPIAELYRLCETVPVPTGKGVVQSLAELRCMREGVQFVHCCALEEGDIEAMRGAGVTVAHCPRSNERLQCPRAPVREMLDAGIDVGLGLDSAASSGPFDMFAEMRAALEVSRLRGRPVSPEEVWSMATGMGRRSVPIPGDPWRIEVGSRVPLIAILVPDATCIEEVIEAGSPELVRWL